MDTFTCTSRRVISQACLPESLGGAFVARTLEFSTAAMLVLLMIESLKKCTGGKLCSCQEE
jgi:hypothetical protein